MSDGKKDMDTKCQKCGATFTVADEKMRGKTFEAICIHCGATRTLGPLFVVDDPTTLDELIARFEAWWRAHGEAADRCADDPEDPGLTRYQEGKSHGFMHAAELVIRLRAAGYRLMTPTPAAEGGKPRCEHAATYAVVAALVAQGAPVETAAKALDEHLRARFACDAPEDHPEGCSCPTPPELEARAFHAADNASELVLAMHGSPATEAATRFAQVIAMLDADARNLLAALEAAGMKGGQDYHSILRLGARAARELAELRRSRPCACGTGAGSVWCTCRGIAPQQVPPRRRSFADRLRATAEGLVGFVARARQASGTPHGIIDRPRLGAALAGLKDHLDISGAAAAEGRPEPVPPPVARAIGWALAAAVNLADALDLGEGENDAERLIEASDALLGDAIGAEAKVLRDRLADGA